MSKENPNEFKIINKNERLKYRQIINQLKQQLAEKDCRIEELEGQFTYECECNKQLVELQKQLEKKQNEIAELEQELTELKEKMQEEISRREIYFISWLGNKVCKGYVIGYNEEDKFIIICGEDMISTNEIFTYEQEAQAKLQELRGGE